MIRVWRSFRKYFFDLYFGFVSSTLMPIFFRQYFWRLGGVKVNGRVYIGAGGQLIGNRLTLESHVVMAYGAYLDCSASIYIGERVHLGPMVSILSIDHKIMPSVYRRESMQADSLGVRIGRGCWIGASSVILPGVTIGEGCVVAAGAVVNRDCSPNGLYAGVPATRIKELPLI